MFFVWIGFRLLRFKLGTSAICPGSASQMAEALQFWGSEVVSSRVPGGFMGLDICTPLRHLYEYS